MWCFTHVEEEEKIWEIWRKQICFEERWPRKEILSKCRSVWNQKSQRKWCKWLWCTFSKNIWDTRWWEVSCVQSRKIPRKAESKLWKFLAQRPKRNSNDSDAVWYDNSSVGHNTLGNVMKTISMKAELSTLYTNNCIRATCITSLDQRGIEARHILSVSEHKSETSIKSYSRCVSETKKQEIFDVLSSVVYPSPKLGPEDPVVVSTNACTNSSESLLLNLDNCEFETVSTK